MSDKNVVFSTGELGDSRMAEQLAGFVAEKKDLDEKVENPAGGISKNSPNVSEGVAKEIAEEVERITRQESEKSQEFAQPAEQPIEPAKEPEDEEIKNILSIISQDKLDEMVARAKETQIKEAGVVSTESEQVTLTPDVKSDVKKEEESIVDSTIDSSDNFIKEDVNHSGGNMIEEESFKPENQASNSRLEISEQMRSEGATEDTRRNANGDVFRDSFSPTAEQINTAQQEMESELNQQDRMNSSRFETYGQMRAEGATEDTRRNANGDVFRDSFSPTAEQINAAQQEMENHLSQQSSQKESEDSENPNEPAEEIKDQSEPQDEIKEQPGVDDKTENEELSLIKQLEIANRERDLIQAKLEEFQRNAVAAQETNDEAEDEVSDEDSENEPVRRAVGWAGVSGGTETQESSQDATETEEASPETEALSPEEIEKNERFENTRDEYLKILAGQRRWIFGRPTAEQLSQARSEFERAVIDQSLASAEKIVDERYSELQGEERDTRIRAQAAAEMVYHVIDRTEAEEEIQNRSLPRSAFNWIKQHPKLRLFTGLALSGGAIASMATGNVVGAAAFISMRAALSGIGTGIMVEGAADYVQTKTNKKLRELTPDQINGMSPEELRSTVAAIGAYEVRRGRNFENSKFRETALNILAQQEQDLIRRMTEIESQTGNTEIARGRALTEYLNQANVERESADLDERSKSIVRGIAAGIAGAVVTTVSMYTGLKSITPRPGDTTDVGGGDITPRTAPGEGGGITPDTAPGGSDAFPEINPDGGSGIVPETPPGGSDVYPEITPNVGETITPDIGSALPTGETVTVAEYGQHIWGITEDNLQNLADRLGYELTPNQMEAAIDRGKDFYVSSGFGRGKLNHLWPGDRVPFDLRQGTEWLRYGMDHPKL
jgi:hypothetical protein